MNCHSLRTHCPHLNGSIQSESRTVLKNSFFSGSLALVELRANIHSFFPGVEGMYLFKPFHRKDYIVLFPDSAFSLVFSLWISHLILVSAHLLLWSAHLAFPLSFFFPPLVSLLQTHQWPSPPHISLHVRAPVGHVSSAMFHFYSCSKKKKKTHIFEFFHHWIHFHNRSWAACRGSVLFMMHTIRMTQNYVVPNQLHWRAFTKQWH